MDKTARRSKRTNRKMSKRAKPTPKKHKRRKRARFVAPPLELQLESTPPAYLIEESYEISPELYDQMNARLGPEGDCPFCEGIDFGLNHPTITTIFDVTTEAAQPWPTVSGEVVTPRQLPAPGLAPQKVEVRRVEEPSHVTDGLAYLLRSLSENIGEIY